MYISVNRNTILSHLMRITILALFALFLYSSSSFGQNTFNIKGATGDTASMVKLTSTVTILNAKDSILIKYVHAGNGGAFDVNGLRPGKYLLLATYPEYADYVEAFTLDALHPTHDFGNINMQLKANLLKEVLIKGAAQAIKIKGDTTEFNAKAYVIQPNSKVEDLLKQFPGMEIDRNGKITVNGEKVDKVLLDGEEFFGDDPTLITRNIRGDMVDKVQLYDKKSDQAAFSGVDDGKKIKTLNVILKEDKKSGTFGKLNAGAGTDQYYEGQAIYNKFQAKNKFSVYGTIADDGVTGLGFDDNSALGISGATDISGDGGTIIILGGGTGLDGSTYNGTGSPLAKNGGAHYDGKWDKDKESINGNYRVGSLGVSTDRETISEQNLPNGMQDKTTTSNSYTYNDRQKADATYQYIPNTTSLLKIAVDGAIRNNNNRSNSNATATDGNGLLLNNQINTQDSKSHDEVMNASILYNKRFKKVGRTLSWNLNGSYDENTATNYVYSDLFTQATATHNIINQYKPSTGTKAVINNNVIYTEPITPKLQITFNYGFGLNNSASDQESYNQSTPGRYDVLDTTYSNNYKFNQLTNQVGASFNYRPNTKVIITVANKVSAVNYKQVDENTGTAYLRDFIKIAPNANFNYRIATGQTISASYFGNDTEPSISQIQPIKVNTDQTNIVIGNANLRSAFTNRFSMFYIESHAVTNSSLTINANYSFTTNQIINNAVYDYTKGTSTTQYVNLSNKTPYNYNINMNSNWRSKFLGGVQLSARLSTNGSVNYNYTNQTLDQTSTQSYSPNFRIGKTKKDKYTLSTSFGPSLTVSRDLLQPNYNNNAVGFTSFNDVTIYLPGKLEFNSTLDYTYTGKTPALPATNYTRWDASLGRTFLKEKNLKIALAGNNILDQTRNNRFQQGGIITQNTYNTIRRYFMLSVTWDFTKFGTTSTSTPAK